MEEEEIQKKGGGCGDNEIGVTLLCNYRFWLRALKT